MHEVRYLKDEEEPKFQYIRDMGDFNKLPRPFRKSNQHEFRQKFSNNTPSYIEYRQIKFRGSNRLTSVQIMYFHDMAFAIVFDGKWHLKNHKVVYDEPIKYIKIGCEHEKKELSPKVCAERNILHFGMCWHVYECTKCGMVETIDSSG